MRILVCLKAVPGFVLGARIAEDAHSIEYQSSSVIINEPDEYALEEALALRSQHGGRVTAITLGPANVDDVLRTALGKGADQAIRIESKLGDPGTTSLVLAAAIRRFDFDLILVGVESWDNMASHVGIAIANRLQVPFVFGINSLALSKDNVVRVEREYGGGSSQVLDITLPALLCIQAGTRRLGSVPAAKLIFARRRPIEYITTNDLGLDLRTLNNYRRPNILAVEVPKRKQEIQILSGDAGDLALKVIDILTGKTIAE